MNKSTRQLRVYKFRRYDTQNKLPDNFKTGSRRVISQSPRRNLQMIVDRGTDEFGRGFTKTFHEKIDKNLPADPKPRRDQAQSFFNRKPEEE